MIPTLTPKEAVDRLRELGMNTSETAIRDGIEQKIFPFGDCVVINDGAKRGRRFYIYEKLFDEWIAERNMPSTTVKTGVVSADTFYHKNQTYV